MKTFCKGVSLVLHKNGKVDLENGAIFCIVNNYFLFKQMFNVDAVLDGKLIDYKVHQSLASLII